MPDYLYHCANCNIDLVRKEPMMVGAHDTAVCPECGQMSPRVYLFNRKIPDCYGGGSTNKLLGLSLAINRHKRELVLPPITPPSENV